MPHLRGELLVLVLSDFFLSFLDNTTHGTTPSQNELNNITNFPLKSKLHSSEITYFPVLTTLNRHHMITLCIHKQYPQFVPIGKGMATIVMSDKKHHNVYVIEIHTLCKPHTPEVRPWKAPARNIQ